MAAMATTKHGQVASYRYYRYAKAEFDSNERNEMPIFVVPLIYYTDRTQHLPAHVIADSRIPTIYIFPWEKLCGTGKLH